MEESRQDQSTGQVVRNHKNSIAQAGHRKRNEPCVRFPHLVDGDRRRAFSFSGEVKISGAVADLLEEIKIPTSGKTGPEMGHPG